MKFEITQKVQITLTSTGKCNHMTHDMTLFVKLQKAHCKASASLHKAYSLLTVN